MRGPSCVRGFVTSGLLATAVSMHSVAHASPADVSLAEAEFRRGRAAVESGDYAAACPAFAESLRLDYAPGTLLNLAACEEHQGRLTRAWEHYTQLAERLPDTDERREIAVERSSSLGEAVPRLTVVVATTAPPATRVERDGVALDGASLGALLPLDPGPHTVAVDAPGRSARRWAVTLRPGERRVLVVEPGGPMPPARARGTGGGARAAAWVVGGAGAVALGVGAFFGVRALTQRSDSDSRCSGTVCSDPAGAQLYEQAQSSARIADVSLSAGVLALAAAGFLLLTSRPDDAPSTAPSVSLGVGAGGLGGTW